MPFSTLSFKLQVESVLTKLAILLGQGISREKIASKWGESTRGELTSQDQKDSMSDSKLVEAFLDALRVDTEDADRSEGPREKELRKEFQSIMLPMILCSTAGQGNVLNPQELLRYGASPNATDYDNCSPLHIACCEGHFDVIKILVCSGANINACDRWGKTPLDDALRSSKARLTTAIVDYLKENGGKTGDVLRTSTPNAASPLVGRSSLTHSGAAPTDPLASSSSKRTT